MDPEALISFIAERGLDGEKTCHQLLTQFENSGREVFDFLEASGLGSKEEILRFIAEEQGCEFIDLDAVHLPSEVISAIEPDILRIYECLPLEVSEHKARVCIVDPLDAVAITELASLLRKEVDVSIADPSKIKAILARLANGEAIGHRPGLVAASSGHSPIGRAASRTRESRHVSAALLVSLSALAMTTTAALALYASQNKRHEQWKYQADELAKEHEALVSRVNGAQTKIADLEADLHDLEKREAEEVAKTIQLEQLRSEVAQMKGRLKSIGNINPAVEGASPAGELSAPDIQRPN